MVSKGSDPRSAERLPTADLSHKVADAKKAHDRLSTAALDLKRAVEAQDFQPPLLPEVAVRLTELSGTRFVSADGIEKIVARDPAVAGKVLARANSAHASRGVQIQSLRLAITRLGVHEVRDLAFELVARSRLFTVAEHAARMRELLDAAQAAGVLARAVCSSVGLELDLAYLCGLLHDMGEAIILGLCSDAARQHRVAIPDELRQGLIERFHSAVGARVWSLVRACLPPLLARSSRREPFVSLASARAFMLTMFLLE